MKTLFSQRSPFFAQVARKLERSRRRKEKGKKHKRKSDLWQQGSSCY